MKFKGIIIILIGIFFFFNGMSNESKYDSQGVYKIEKKEILIRNNPGGSCDWGVCVDDCYATRNNCFDEGGDSSTCDPQYDRCKEQCDNNCR